MMFNGNPVSFEDHHNSLYYKIAVSLVGHDIPFLLIVKLLTLLSMKELKAFSFFILMLLIWGNLKAQNTSITVLDKETKKPIPYANLCFEGMVEGAKTYGITSLDGKAKNDVKEKSLLVISFVGYETLIDTVHAHEEIIYELNPDLFNLNQVVITATRTEKALKDVPAITQVLLSSERNN